MARRVVSTRKIKETEVTQMSVNSSRRSEMRVSKLILVGKTQKDLQMKYHRNNLNLL